MNSEKLIYLLSVRIKHLLTMYCLCAQTYVYSVLPLDDCDMGLWSCLQNFDFYKQL